MCLSHISVIVSTMKPRLIRPMEGDKIHSVDEIPASFGRLAPVNHIDDLPVKEREDLLKVFHAQNPTEAAQRIAHLIQTVGKDGYVWIRSTDHRLKVGGKDYGAGPDEQLVGVYAPAFDIAELADDILAICPDYLGAKQETREVKKERTHKITRIEETTETVTATQRVVEPVAAPIEMRPVELPVIAPVVPEPPKPEPIALPAPEPVTCHKAEPDIFQKYLAQISEAKSKLALARLMNLLRSHDDLEALTFIVKDYVDMMGEAGITEADGDISYIVQAKRFREIFEDINPQTDSSPIGRAAHVIREWGSCNTDCVGEKFDVHATTADECAELAAIIDGKNLTAEGNWNMMNKQDSKP